MRLLAAFVAVFALLASPLAAQSTKVIDPSTGQPVFSSANPAPVTVVGTTTTTPSVTGNGTAATAQRVTIASDSTGSITATGNVASGATDSGNPVKVGGKYNATLPTLTDGQRADAQTGTRGSLNVTLFAQDSTASINAGTPSSDALGTSGTALESRSITYAFNGTSFDRARGDVNGIVVQPGLSSTTWRYTSGTTAILSNTTTAVTIKAAAGASVKNMIDACQIASTALGASVPFVIRDGAAGTVMWAMRPPTAGWTNPIYVNFSPPLVGTANTLIEVATSTADTSGTFDVNCQGHTGS